MKISAIKGQSISQFLERWYPLMLTTLVGYFLADLVTLYIRPTMLPTKAPPAKQAPPPVDQFFPAGYFAGISTKNIFNWDGTMPDPLTPKGQKNKPGSDQEPVLSQLPLNLIGTIVHSKPEKSVASIDVKGKNQSVSVRVKAEIENIAEIVKIERNKVIFRNLNSNQLEYIEVQSKSKLSFQGTSTAQNHEEVTTTGENQFTIKKGDLLKYTSNLAAILQKARSEPHRDPQTGVIDGFTVLDFEAGSIFEKLGLKRMDVIKGVNGEVVDTPQKALELFTALRNSDKINLSVDRGGKSETLDYSITK